MFILTCVRAIYGSNSRDDEIFLSDTLVRNRNIPAGVRVYYSALARGADRPVRTMIRQRGIWRIPRRAFFESTSLRGSYKNSSPDITRGSLAREYRC